MKKILIIISLILLISGCIGQVSSSNKGVEIKSFEFAPDKISAGQKTLLSIGIINEGAVDILEKEERKAYIYLYGIPEGDWTIPTDKLPSGVSEKETSSDNRIIGPIDLYASNQQFDLPAGERGVIWIPQFTGSLPKDQTFNYDFQARVCYDYYTETVGKVELVSEEEWLSKFGEIKQHPIELDHTAGPLRVKIDSQQPIIVSGDGSEISLELELENVGGGTIAKPTYDCSKTSNDLNYAKITSISIGPLENPICKNEDIECMGIEADKTIFFSRGKTGKFVCKVKCSGSIPEQRLDLTLRFDYKYYKDAGARIEVEGV